MNIRRTLLGAIAAVSATALLSGTAVRAADLPPITIPVILPQSGGGAFLGATQLKTLQILQDSVNASGGIKGHPLKFQFLDDTTNPAVAKQLGAQEQTLSPIVLGSSLSAMCKAIAPMYDTAGPVNYCLSPAIYPNKGSYVFSTSASTKDLLIATVRFFREKGWKKFGLLASEDASGQDGVDDVNEALKDPANAGMQLVDTERYGAQDVTATAQLTNIKGKGPQALIIWAPGTQFGTALRNVSDLGLDIPIATTSANMVDKQLLGYASFLPKELYFPGVSYAAGLAQNPAVKKQQDTYFAAMKAAGVTTDLQTGMPWDAALLTIEALKKLGPTATGAQIRDYLAGVKGWAGILGTYDFTKYPQRGVSVDDVVMMRWTGTGWLTSSSFGGSLK